MSNFMAALSGGAIFFIVVCAMFPALILVAVVVKYVEVRRPKRWPSTTGKVIASTVKSRVNHPGDPGYDFHDTEVTNEPFVQYEYKVGTRTHRCSRITIGEKTSPQELEQILQRYPVGAAVTVYYDPKNPDTAVLERDIFNVTMYAALGVLLLLFIGGPLLAVFSYYKAEDWFKGHAAGGNNAPFLAALSCFSSLVLLFAVGYLTVVFQSWRWPTARGRIVAAETQAYESGRHDDAGVQRTYFRPSVRYTYEVNGHQYMGDRVSMGVKISATVPGLVRRLAARYPVGKEVVVRYDPKSPGESVLKSFSPIYLLPLVIGVGLFVLAWAIATGRL